jgi:hypothetical protein
MAASGWLVDTMPFLERMPERRELKNMDYPFLEWLDPLADAIMRLRVEQVNRGDRPKAAPSGE